MRCRAALRKHQKGSPQVRCDYSVECGHIPSGDLEQWHNSRAVDNDIGFAEGHHRLFEKPFHVCGVGHIGLHGDRLSAARGLDLFYYGLRWGYFAGAVHNHGEAVLR